MSTLLDIARHYARHGSRGEKKKGMVCQLCSQCAGLFVAGFILGRSVCHWTASWHPNLNAPHDFCYVQSDRDWCRPEAETPPSLSSVSPILTSLDRRDLAEAPVPHGRIMPWYQFDNATHQAGRASRASRAKQGRAWKSMAHSRTRHGTRRIRRRDMPSDKPRDTSIIIISRIPTLPPQDTLTFDISRTAGRCAQASTRTGVTSPDPSLRTPSPASPTPCCSCSRSLQFRLLGGSKSSLVMSPPGGVASRAPLCVLSDGIHPRHSSEKPSRVSATSRVKASFGNSDVVLPRPTLYADS